MQLVWFSRGKCAPYAVPRKMRPKKTPEDLYSSLKKVRFGCECDFNTLRLKLLSNPRKAEVPHRRRYLRFGSYFCSMLDER
ncbi:hypothetical protein OESDEN_03085 [Oesophagostomum dentatum]|uniref:Uncharacterized protein n=1 Tax=Oesophagostomum dentatum TaxID=61180 RepID=A0A0B1TLF5_OESDE|nr:hypothetical protein OESDEN_03085 [Oesophagostomum dentatum]